MAIKIEDLLADALLELCKDKPLKNITIKDLRDRTGISRQSFYNHFKDKNDLIQWIYYHRVLVRFQEVCIEEDYYKDLLDYYNRVAEYHYFLKPAALMTDQNCLREYMYEHPFQWELKYHEIWCRENQTEAPVEEELRFFTRYHALASVGITIEWILEDMPVTPEVMADRIAYLKRIGMSQILKDSEEKPHHLYR